MGCTRMCGRSDGDQRARLPARLHNRVLAQPTAEGFRATAHGRPPGAPSPGRASQPRILQGQRIGMDEVDNEVHDHHRQDVGHDGHDGRHATHAAAWRRRERACPPRRAGGTAAGAAAAIADQYSGRSCRKSHGGCGIVAGCRRRDWTTTSASGSTNHQHVAQVAQV